MAFINLQAYTKQALQEVQEGKISEAEQKFNYILEIYPNHPLVLYGLATVYSKQGRCAMSMMAYEKSLKIDPYVSECWNNLGGMYRKFGLMDDCRHAFNEAIRISETEKFKEGRSVEEQNKLRADYLSNLGSSYVADHNAEKALEIFDIALKSNKGCKNALWNRSLAYLELGRWEEGFRDYDCGNRLDVNHSRNYNGQAQSVIADWWDGSPGKTVVIYGEQGIGDEIMFASIIPDMIKDCKKVILDAHERLISIFRRSFPQVDVYGTRKHSELEWVRNYDIDAQVAIGSLGKFYRKKDEDFPGDKYLIADDKLKSKIMDKLSALSNKKNIGISWKGGTRSSSKDVRCMPLEEFAPLMRAFPEYNFISLQYQKHTPEEVDAFNEKHLDEGLYIYHWQNIIDDYDLTAALLIQLDIIVSVPQSVVHLAGALGVKTYQLCPYRGLWQMGVYGCEMPWYKSVKNIWQPSDDAWKECVIKVIERIGKDN